MLDVVVIGAGQAGLAMGRELQQSGLDFRILESSAEIGGSWPKYYDSLTLFSPVEYSGLPGLPFPGERGRYPSRDDVTAYLSRYADVFGLPIVRQQTVTSVKVNSSAGFEVATAEGKTFGARSVVVATGTFGSPYSPSLPGQDTFEGRILHAAEYRNADSFIGQRVVVVGAANSAVQIAVELGKHTEVILATRERIRFVPQRILGKDIHFWFKTLGVDRSKRISDQGTPVLDDGRYRRAIKNGAPAAVPMFHRFTPSGVRWTDGPLREVDAVIYATGYRPHIPFLDSNVVIGANGKLRQKDGASLDFRNLYFVGQPGLRSFQSGTLRGVGVDAPVVAARLRSELNRPASL